MTDQNDNKAKGSILGFNKKPPPPPSLTRAEKLKRSIDYSLSEVDRLDNEMTHWKEKAIAFDEELERMRREHPAEVATLKHEYESKLGMARYTNDQLTTKLSDVGIKMESYLQEALRLKTNSSNLQFMVQKLFEQQIEFAKRQSDEKIAFATAQIKQVVEFIQEMDQKHPEFRPKPVETPKVELPEDEDAKKIGAKFGYNSREHEEEANE